MKLNWGCLIALVSGMVFVQSPVMAIDCEELTREQRETLQETYSEIVVVGVIDDTRNHGVFKKEPSELDELDKGEKDLLASEFGLGHYLVLVEEGTNKVYTLYVRRPKITYEDRQRLIGHRAKVTGCRPSMFEDLVTVDFNDIELLP